MRYPVVFVIAVIIGIFRAAGSGGSGGPHHMTYSREPTLKVRHETDRVVMEWSGEVKEPMRQRFAEAFKALGDEPQRVLITFNSPGGSVQTGHEVIEVIHKAARLHYIETAVEGDNVCASMCVPLYLAGIERYASASARFMFHEVILVPRPGADRDVMRELKLSPSELAMLKRQAVGHYTDKLFEDGFETKLNSRWLASMRQRIKGRDVWLTGRELVEEKAGVVDKLL